MRAQWVCSRERRIILYKRSWINKCRFTVCKVLAALIYRVLLHKSRFAVCNWGFACISSDLESVTEVLLHTLMQVCRLKGFACIDLPCFAVEGQSLDCKVIVSAFCGPFASLVVFSSNACMRLSCINWFWDPRHYSVSCTKSVFTPPPPPPLLSLSPRPPLLSCHVENMLWVCP